MSWPNRTLGEILELSGNQRAGEQDLPVLSITMKDGLVDQAEKFKKRVASKNTSNYRVALENELVVGFPIDEGVLGFQTKYRAGIVSPAYNIWRLKNAEECHIPYLEFYLRSPQARRSYASRMQGAVARRRSLTKKDFLELDIPFPPIEDQVRIAWLVSKVDALIDQRMEQISKFDHLLKSAFLKWFGDPATNPMGWDETTIGELADEVKYGTSASAKGGQFKYLRMNNITRQGRWNFDKLKSIDLPKKDFEKYSLKRGDLVFNRTNSKEQVGKSAVYASDEPVVIAGYLIRVRFKPGVNPWYVWGHLNSDYGKRVLFNLCRNIIGMANINAQELKAITVLLPPVNLQKKFAQLVEAVEKTVAEYEQSLLGFQALRETLSSHAINDQLDLSRVVVANEKPSLESGDERPLVKLSEPLEDIQLPNTALLLGVLEDQKNLSDLLHFWLNSYSGQLDGQQFDTERFFAAANRRMSTAYPESDFDLGLDGYEIIKTWVFEALAEGKLIQGYSDLENRIQLLVVQE